MDQVLNIIFYDFLKKKTYRSRKVTFDKKQFPGLNNGSRPAIKRYN